VTETRATEAGRRERKKAATRKTIAEAALRLFLERGYDGVTVRDVAEEADVAATTLLNYFPTKESLVFTRGADIEASLISAIAERPTGVSPLAALRAHFKERVALAVSSAGAAQFRALVESSGPLIQYERDLWLRLQETLAVAIAESSELAANDQRCFLAAGFALQAFTMALRSENPVATVDLGFDIIEQGWPVG
jgi:AcrR family transcriptional regulator